MTTYNKTTLKTFFETGDVPQGSDYANFIDSYVNIVETGLQTMSGPLQATELIAPRVSATNFNVTGTFSTNAITGTTGSFSSKVSANSLTADTTVSAASLNVTGDVSAASGTVYASAVRMGGGGLYRTVAIISAAGTTQATGAGLGTVGIYRLKGIVDDSTTGFKLAANRTGLQQTLYVEENTSCNLWPCTGGQINGLSSDAAFSMAGNGTYIVTHIGASAYSVK